MVHLKNDIVGSGFCTYMIHTDKNLVQIRWVWHAMHGEVSLVYNIDAGPI